MSTTIYGACRESTSLLLWISGKANSSPATPAPPSRPHKSNHLGRIPAPKSASQPTRLITWESYSQMHAIKVDTSCPTRVGKGPASPAARIILVNAGLWKSGLSVKKYSNSYIRRALPPARPQPRAGGSTSSFTGAIPVRSMPIFIAAPDDRSITRSGNKMPRSVIRTTTDRRFRKLITRTSVPNGSVG